MEELQLVTFRLGTELYGINISKVREIIKVIEITSVPKAYYFVEGLINLRGVIVPVIDLRKMFEITSIGEDKENRIVVVEVNDRILGILVDSVSEVMKLNTDNIEPVPATLSGIDNKYLGGVGKVDDQILIILKIEKVLSSENLITSDMVHEVANV